MNPKTITKIVLTCPIQLLNNTRFWTTYYS